MNPEDIGEMVSQSITLPFKLVIQGCKLIISGIEDIVEGIEETRSHSVDRR